MVAGSDREVGIAFKDGARFRARVAPNKFDCGPNNTAKVLLSLTRGAFTFISTVAKTDSPKIGTPVARIRGAAQGGGFGILTLAALALPLLEELQAAILDEDRITYDDLPHGRFEITTKEAVPKVFLIEHPGETVVLHRQGSTLTVEHITNAPARMEELQAAQQGALRTFTLGVRDTFIERQQRADISQPTSTSSGGSSGTAAPSNPSDTSPITTHLTATDVITAPSSTTDSVTSSLSVASNNLGTSNTILVVTNTTSASVLPPLTLVVADAPALSQVAGYPPIRRVRVLSVARPDSERRGQHDAGLGERVDQPRVRNWRRASGVGSGNEHHGELQFSERGADADRHRHAGALPTGARQCHLRLDRTQPDQLWCRPQPNHQLGSQ